MIILVELQDGMLPADCRVIDEDITKILQPSDETELFLLDINFANNRSLLNYLEAALLKKLQKRMLG